MFGLPFWMRTLHYRQYLEKSAQHLVNDITNHVSQEITNLLTKGCV